MLLSYAGRPFPVRTVWVFFSVLLRIVRSTAA